MMDSSDPAQILKLQGVLQQMIDKTKTLIHKHPMFKQNMQFMPQMPGETNFAPQQPAPVQFGNL